MNTEKFYQWDINQRLVIEDANIKEVHFSNVLTPTAIVMKVYEEDGKRYVSVPQMLLEQPYNISAYASCGECVEFDNEYEVVKRAKPENYDASAYSATGIYKMGDSTVIKHNLGVMPKHIVLYAEDTAVAPSNIEEIYQTYKEVLHTSAIKNEDDTYTTKATALSYQRFEYYASASATTKSTRMIQRISKTTGLKIVNITNNTFTIPEDCYNSLTTYRWIVLA